MLACCAHMIESLNTIRSLELPSVVEDLYFGRSVPSNLQIYLKYPSEFHNRRVEECRMLTAGGVVPLLSDGNFSDIYCFDASRRKFVIKSAEEPDKTQREFDSWQQFLAYKLLEIADSGVTDDELVSIADVLEFSHTDELISLLHRMEELSDEASLHLAEEFIQTFAG